MERTVHKLLVPIQIGSETITELAFRRPKAKDFRSHPMEGQTMGDVLNLMGKLCGQPPNVIDELSAEDMAAIGAIIGNFTAAGLGIGTKG